MHSFTLASATIVVASTFMGRPALAYEPRSAPADGIVAVQVAGPTATIRGVDIAAAIDVRQDAAGTCGVVLHIDAPLRERVHASLIDGIVRVTADDHVDPGDAAYLEVCTPLLESVRISGVSDARDLRLGGATASVTLDGVGAVQAHVEADALIVQAGGVGAVILDGEVNRLYVESDGLVRVDAGGLRAVDGDVSHRGLGAMIVHVTGTLTLAARQSAGVEVRGAPRRVEP